MPNIVHRIGFENVTPGRLFEAFSTAEGFASWWTVKAGGQSKIGGVFTFRFSKENSGPDFEVLELTPGKRAAFRCVGGPDDWLHTQIEFDICERDGETILLFTHSGWRQEAEFMHHCSTQWAYFLMGLKDFLEGGIGSPYGGNFRPISRWSK